MDSEKIVELTGGRKITVRRVRWAGYVAMKNVALSAIAGPAVHSALTLLQGPVIDLLARLFTDDPNHAPAAPEAPAASLDAYAAEQTVSPPPPAAGPFTAEKIQALFGEAAPLFAAALGELKTELPQFLRGISGVADDLTAVLLKFAVVQPEDGCEWTIDADWQDVANVIDAAYALNDPAELLAREKKFLAAVATSGRKMLQSTAAA